MIGDFLIDQLLYLPVQLVFLAWGLSVAAAFCVRPGPFMKIGFARKPIDTPQIRQEPAVLEVPVRLAVVPDPAPVAGVVELDRYRRAS